MSNDTLPLFKLCSIPSCGLMVLAKGYCRRHYMVAWRTGDPLKSRLDEVTRNCVICGVVFTTSSKSNTVMCRDKACHHIAMMDATHRYREARGPKRVPSVGDFACRYCEQVFAGTGCNFAYCSNECKRRDSSNRKIKRQGKMKAAGWESFSRREIFLRDAWICQLCNLPIDPAVAFPDMMVASIDHIIPVSKGGPHLRSNVQATHLRCNISKGNRMVA